MRHLWSLLAGVVVAPLAWGLIALGQNGSRDQVGDWVSTSRFDTVDLIEPAAYLVVAGILLGLIATLRISPLGPLVGGLLLIAAYVGMFIAPLDVRDAIPDNWEILDRHLPLTEPLDNGTLALVGVLLLMAVFSVDRWRHGPGAAAETPEAPATDSDTSLVSEPVGEAVTAADGPLIAVGAEPGGVSTASSTNDQPVPGPTPSPKSRKSKTRPESSSETPWSAPPGQGRSEQS